VGLSVFEQGDWKWYPAAMNWDFTAATPAELGKGIAPALLSEGGVKRVATEKLQMTRLLESLAQTSILQYPVGVKHTTQQVPDFQLASGDRRIAVELTRIKFQDVEHGRAIQGTEVKGTLSVSSLCPKPGGPRKRREVIEDGFGTPVMLFPISMDDEAGVWLKQAKESLDAKTKVLARNDFARGDENWLVLLDPIGTILPQAQSLKENVSLLLAEFWRDGWFHRVFLQDTYYRWQMAFTPRKCFMLPALAERSLQEGF
jgi:hypothetical protein